MEKKIKRGINCFLIGIACLHVILYFIPLRIEPSELNRIDSNGIHETYFVVSPFGTLVGWGSNEYNLISPVGRFLPYPYFMRRTILRNVTDVGVGRSGAMAVTKDGTLWGWGNFSNSTTKKQIFKSLPMRIMDNVVSVNIPSGSHDTTSVLKKNGELWLWSGELGTNGPAIPRKMMENVKRIYGDSSNVFAINNNNDLYAMSYKLGAVIRHPTFIASGIKDIKSWGSHTYLCLTTDDEVFIYGDKGYEKKVFEPAVTPYEIVADNVKALSWNGLIKDDGSCWNWQISNGERILTKQDKKFYIFNFALAITHDGKLYAEPVIDGLPLIPQSMWTVSPILRNLFLLGILIKITVNKYYKSIKII